MATNYSNTYLDLIPHLTFTFVENYIKSNKSSSSQKSINKGFKYFSEGYIQDLKGYYYYPNIRHILLVQYFSKYQNNTHNLSSVNKLQSFKAKEFISYFFSVILLVL